MRRAPLLVTIYPMLRLFRKSGLLIAAFLMLLIVLCAGVGAALAADPVPGLGQQAPTPTTGGQITLPTATATIVGGPTATPTRTPTLVPVLAETIGDPTNLRSGPGLDFDIVGTVTSGTLLPIKGRAVVLPWLLVEWVDGPNGEAWVFDQLILVRGDITTVPVVEPPAAPTVDPTLQVIQATATVLLQTPGAAQTATAQAFAMPTGVFTLTPEQGLQVSGVLPTFTPPEPYAQPTALAPSANANGARGGLPPAVLIIGLGFMGILTLVLGLIRRF